MEENYIVESAHLTQRLLLQKKEIETLLASQREEIETGRLRVLLTGYVCGRSDQEITVSVVNERDKQTYYGAVDYLEGKLVLKACALPGIQPIRLTIYVICSLTLPTSD